MNRSPWIGSLFGKTLFKLRELVLRDLHVWRVFSACFVRTRILHAVMGIPGLDRKAKEAERLERAKRRAVSNDDASRERPAKIQRLQPSLPPIRPVSPPILKTHDPIEAAGVSMSHRASTPSTEPLSEVSDAGSSKQLNQEDMGRSSSRHGLPSMKDLQYPFGAIKKSWAFGHERHADIKSEEVLQKDKLQIALLSSWQLDFDWVASKLDLNKTKLWLVMQAKAAEEVGSRVPRVCTETNMSKERHVAGRGS